MLTSRTIHRLTTRSKLATTPRLTRNYTPKPPSYFSDHLSSTSTPSTSEAVFTPVDPHSPSSSSTTALTAASPGPSSSKLTSIRDLSVVISILALTYFAIDNYRARSLLEQKVMEQSVAHMKSLAMAQNNFNVQRKKKELMALQERKAAQKREMKMVYHIAMLRKQLTDAGLKPVEIEEAIAEFEKNVKMETSISNVSGTALWVIDESPMKPYVPNTHDYETPKK